MDKEELRSMYLELLKKSLLNLIYPENELRLIYSYSCNANKSQINPVVLRDITKSFAKEFRELIDCRLQGKRTVLQFSHSMIGVKRMDNIQQCAETIFSENIPGDFVETGVWRGGAVIFMRALLRVHDQNERFVWAADSFEGLPSPESEQDKGYEHLSQQNEPFLAIDLETVKDNFRAYDLLDDRVLFLKGWFHETLPTAPLKQISLLRLDGDLYKSTMDALESLYDKVALGGFIIVDDYGDIDACKKAVDEFRTLRNITDRIIPVDWTGVYWRKRS